MKNKGKFNSILKLIKIIFFYRDISVDDYFLLVESLDTEVVAFAPMLASHHPRVIAVGEGNGDLLRVTLLLSEECRLRRSISMSKQVNFLMFSFLKEFLVKLLFVSD